MPSTTVWSQTEAVARTDSAADGCSRVPPPPPLVTTKKQLMGAVAAVVFSGRNLDRKELTAAFNECLVTN